MLDIERVARLEERRIAVSVADVAEEATPLAGGMLCFSGPGSWSSQALGLGMDGPVDGADLDRMIDFYASRSVEPRIEVCPYADDSLIAGLGERGFVLKEFQTILVRPLGDGGLPSIEVPGLEIVPLDTSDDEQTRADLEIRIQGFGVEHLEMFERIMRRVWANQHCHTLLARLDGVYAAAASGEKRGPAGSLIGMCTREGFRGRGLQQALMIARLRHLEELGAEHVCVGTLPTVATGRNALRLGFQVAYTKVAMVRPGAGLTPSP